MKSFTRKTRLDAIKRKKSGPSARSEKLAMFIRCQMDAGVSYERAVEWDRRLNIAGCNN